MNDFTKPSLDDVNKGLLDMSDGCERHGAGRLEIESIEDMSNYIQENVVDMLTCTFLQKKALEEMIKELKKKKLLIFDL